MEYKVITVWDYGLCSVGDILTISEAAQLFECNAFEMEQRSVMASTVELDGIKLEIIP